MRITISIHLICEISVILSQHIMIMSEQSWVLLTVVLGGNLYLEVTIKHSEFGMSEVLVPTKCKFLISFLQ